jgi:putative tryptophan/tyrosine transport system substrate-binding protein
MAYQGEAMNTRRRLISALGAGALTAPFGSFAQQAGRIWRVGFLALRRRPDSIDTDFLGAFPRAMRELGYVEGKNLVIEWRFADSNSERLPELAAELVRLKVDVIVSAASEAISALQKATSTVPIVMATAGDPIGSGFVKSLARPEGNITGLSSLASDIGSKQLELLLSMMAKLTRVAVLVNPANPAHATFLKYVQAEALRVGVKVVPMEARTAQEIENAFPAMTEGNVQAVIVALDGLFIQHYRKIAELAKKNRLPSASSIREFVVAGGLMSYGPNLAEQVRLAATYVDKILKGAKPGDLPVEQSATFELFINGKTAKALGLTIFPELRLRANRVVE